MKNMVTEVAQAIGTLNVSVGHEQLEKFFHFDDENSEVFAIAILKKMLKKRC